ncbi:putative receptor protein kinase ZmPK1 [Beta vulgaris subsp. vulgaris]|uniref:putative receptor protein kinase ZmPK1 n=1 Tax=Beta vulgaris subsp. vulgaris TaxID=3555 RepID=UPI002036ABA2|nr:putative receptor protein kinase ZmPK1 [Beta vulgaris subsp. vulgaris]
MNNQTTLFFLLLFFISTTSSVVLAKNFLSRGSSLTIKDVTNSDNLLISPDKTFSCGFHSFGTNAYWFSIWYTNTKEQTIVWTANPDKPVNRRGSRLSLRRNGAMVLIDYDGTTAWETNTTKSNVDRAELLNTGNLVLKDPTGNILWQSFDHPTDTLLPHQLFTKNKPLVSRIGPQMVGSGYFSLFFDSGNVLKLIYDGPEISSIYWPDITLHAYQNGRTHANNSRIAILDDMGTFSSSDQLEFSASDVGVGIRRRITLDYDGNLRVYSLNESSGFWNITWQAVAMPCDVHGLCGRNGICVYTPEPKCSCPPNYEPTDLSDWNKGCKPKFHRSCSDSEFVELTHVDYYGFDLNRTQSTSYEDCRQSCLRDCRCEAFNYRHTGEALCVTKNSLFNGVRSVNFSGSMYLRVPRSRTQTLNLVMDYNVSRIDCGIRGQGKVLVLPNIYDITNQRFKWIYIYVFAFVIGTLEVVLLAAGWWFLYKKHGLSASMEDGYRAISNQFRSFNYSELRNATKNFKEIIGRGGFGAVYKGILADKRVVAVKKLENVVQGEEEFWAEVSTIGKINHMNLARMWGFCCGKKQRLLVYEHVENGSLDQHLFLNKTFLDWKQRFKVAIGTAKGLAYLHHECLEWVIHCDVKPENILLDGEFEPKISDFGLAKLCQRESHGSSDFTGIRGTKGYMAPEWAMNLPITAKVDVYSYGVVILELVKGIRLSSWVVDDHDGFEEVPELLRFMRIAKKKMQNGEDSWVEDLIDPRLEGKFNRNQAATMIEVGLSCVQDDRNKRPTMESVVQVLAECEEEMPVHTPCTI